MDRKSNINFFLLNNDRQQKKDSKLAYTSVDKFWFCDIIQLNSMPYGLTIYFLRRAMAAAARPKNIYLLKKTEIRKEH
jgi:hypothetical protein